MAKILETSLETQVRMAEALRQLLSLLDFRPEFGPNKKSFKDTDFQNEDGTPCELFDGWISTFLYKEDSRSVTGKIECLRRTLEGAETGEILVDYLNVCDQVMKKSWNIESKFKKLSSLINTPENESTYIKDEVRRQETINKSIQYTLKELEQDLSEFNDFKYKATQCRNKLRDVKLVEEVNGVQTDKREWE